MAIAQPFENRIPYTPALINNLEKDLCSLLSYPKSQIKISRKPPLKGTPITTFYTEFMPGYPTGHGECSKTYIEPGKREQPWNIAKAIRKGASLSSVWVGCRLRFDLEAENYLLTSASLMFLACRNHFYPLIRAEWDHRGIATMDLDHAQPHWHVLTALQKASLIKEFHADVPVNFSFVDEANSTESIHLAMGTDWHKKDGNVCLNHIPCEKSLCNWVQQTVKYSIEQIYYALRKQGERLTSREEIKEFS